MKVAYALIAIALLLPGTASAQDVMVSRMRAMQETAVPTDPVEIGMVYYYGKCIVQRSNSGNVFRKLPESETSSRMLWSLAYASPACTKYSTKQPYALHTLRGPLAEALVQREVYGNGEALRSGAYHVYSQPDAAELAKMPSEEAHAVRMVAMGQCIAKADPAGAKKLLNTNIMSPEQTYAINALRPALAQCAPKGEPLRVTEFGLRGYIAEGVLRNAVLAEGSKG